jgi:hypothetical protein
VLADAKAKAGPTVADARDKAAPLLVQSAALAAERAAAAADLAAQKAAAGRDLAAAKAEELKRQQKKTHRLRNFLVFGGLVALLGFVAKKLRGGDRENWQSSYTPTPPPAPARSTTSETPIADAAAAASVEEAADEGGAGPDEALADAVEESHPVTTPEDPAEVVDLQPDEAATEKPTTP